MPDSAQQDFLKDLNPDEKVDVFDQPLEPQPETVEVEKEVPSEDTGNRQVRRLRAKLEEERIAGIELAARLKAIKEAQELNLKQNPEIDETIARIYGTNTPEAAEATSLLAKAIKAAEDRATERAIKTFEERQAEASLAVKREESKLDDMVADIEDSYGVSLDSQTEKGFFQLLEKLSPKDREGNIIEYADHHAVWEEMQARRAPTPNRAKELASRSMVRTGSSPDTSVADDVGLRFLKDNGII